MKNVAWIVGVDEKTVRNVLEDRGVIFTVGDPPTDDHFVCECCLGAPENEIAVGAGQTFWAMEEERATPDVNVCTDCLSFAGDPWRAGMVRRYRKGSRIA